MTELPLVRRELTALGFCHVKHLSKLESTGVLNSLGIVLHTTDAAVDTSCRALASPDRALDLHTDHSRVRYVAWYCLRPPEKGGVSLLLDSWPLLGSMSEDELVALRGISLIESRLFDNEPGHCPMLRFRQGMPQLYYSSQYCDKSDRDLPAMQKFRSLVAQSSVVGIGLAANDLLIVDNWRMLHGRTRIEGRKDRHFERYWIE